MKIRSLDFITLNSEQLNVSGGLIATPSLSSNLIILGVTGFGVRGANTESNVALASDTAGPNTPAGSFSRSSSFSSPPAV